MEVSGESAQVCFSVCCCVTNYPPKLSLNSKHLLPHIVSGSGIGNSLTGWPWLRVPQEVAEHVLARAALTESSTGAGGAPSGSLPHLAAGGRVSAPQHSPSIALPERPYKVVTGFSLSPMVPERVRKKPCVFHDLVSEVTWYLSLVPHGIGHTAQL